MANPQLEDGYTRIANELLEALCCFRISGEARQVFDTILRKTYGFGKKEDSISLSQFVLATKLSKSNICASIKHLLLLNVIITQKDNDIAIIYSINKDFSTWKSLPKKITLPKKIMVVTQKDNLPLPKKSTTKDNITKETITKEIYTPSFDAIWSMYPNRVGKKAALKHFKASVKSEQDAHDIQIALTNYLKSDRVLNGYIQNGSTWFNNWRDWLTLKPESFEERRNREVKETIERLNL